MSNEFRDAVRFILDNPNELQHVLHRMKDAEEKRTRPEREAVEAARRAALPLKHAAGVGTVAAHLRQAATHVPAASKTTKTTRMRTSDGSVHE